MTSPLDFGESFDQVDHNEPTIPLADHGQLILALDRAIEAAGGYYYAIENEPTEAADALTIYGVTPIEISDLIDELTDHGFRIGGSNYVRNQLATDGRGSVLTLGYEWESPETADDE